MSTTLMTKEERQTKVSPLPCGANTATTRMVMVKALVGDRDPKHVIEALQELQKRKEAKDESK